MLTHMQKQACTHACVHETMHACMHTTMYSCMCVCIYAHSCAHTHTPIETYLEECTYKRQIRMLFYYNMQMCACSHVYQHTSLAGVSDLRSQVKMPSCLISACIASWSLVRQSQQSCITKIETHAS